MITEIENIVRSECGFWTHPELPDWDEGTSVGVIQEWEKDNSLKLKTVWFDGDAPDELHDRYFEAEELNSLSEWQPTNPASQAFLISIHDTEDGPCAVFGVPLVSGALIGCGMLGTGISRIGTTIGENIAIDTATARFEKDVCRWERIVVKDNVITSEDFIDKTEGDQA